MKRKLNIISIWKIFLVQSFIISLIYFKNLKAKLKISVIIPTYNREKLISKSIKSVLNQTYKKFEIIIIDDGSTDNTKKEIGKIKDRRIKYIKLPKKTGASNARNVGIKAATGDYITFQDSDDILHHNKLQKQIKNIIKNKSNFDFCKICVHNNKTHKYIIPTNKTEIQINKGNIYNELLNNGNFISTQSILVKTSCIKNYQFDNNMPRLQDFDLLLRLLPKVKVSYTNEVLVDLYIQKNSITSSKIKLKYAIQRLLIKLKKDYNLNRFQRNNFTRYLNFLNKHLNFSNVK